MYTKIFILFGFHVGNHICIECVESLLSNILHKKFWYKKIHLKFILETVLGATHYGKWVVETTIFMYKKIHLQFHVETVLGATHCGKWVVKTTVDPVVIAPPPDTRCDPRTYEYSTALALPTPYLMR